MERSLKGDVVIVPFPYSDLSTAKRRPALVVAVVPGNDLILCQITSQTVKDGFAIALAETDFDSGSLNKPSNIRPQRLFTADQQIIVARVGALKQPKIDAVVQAIIAILQG